MRRRSRIGTVGVALAALLLGARACSGGNIETKKAANGKTCGDVNIAVNSWVGYEANAYVIGEIAKQRLGCQVNYQKIDEEPSWRGMDNGTVDTVVENWGHQDLVDKYVKQRKTVVEAGPTGNKGVIGWYVPPWMAKKYPDITSWKNLNKYAKLFRTSESGDQGQLLDGSPSYVTNDQALVKNLKLNYKVVVGGSEAALIQSFRSAERNKTPLLAYFCEPQWFFSEMKPVQEHLPPYKPGCDANPAKVACDYPLYKLDKLMSKKFVDSGSPAVTLVKNFSWTNDDQNKVAEYISKDGMSPEAAAKKWIDANPQKVDQWLKGVTG